MFYFLGRIIPSNRYIQKTILPVMIAPTIVANLIIVTSIPVASDNPEQTPNNILLEVFLYNRCGI